MAYTVKEIFYTLQGEGLHAGRPAVFCRLTGCNLWNGMESGRAGASCQFCDTDFVGTDGNLGGKYTAEALAQTMLSLWPKDSATTPFCVLTGGEPAMQFDQPLADALHALNIIIAMETNGTIALQAQPDWLCVSPKADTSLLITSGDELKLVWPQPMHPVDPADFVHLHFRHFYLQPIDGLASNYTQDCIDYCKAHPQWKLSLQTHKILGIE
jgi:7-carboxy-7-deazaguanine synthase (Cx14CxxC type)